MKRQNISDKITLDILKNFKMPPVSSSVNEGANPSSNNSIIIFSLDNLEQ